MERPALKRLLDDAVEPTRSQNMTVIGRRSAKSICGRRALTEVSGGEAGPPADGGASFEARPAIPFISLLRASSGRPIFSRSASAAGAQADGRRRQPRAAPIGRPLPALPIGRREGPGVEKSGPVALPPH